MSSDASGEKLLEVLVRALLDRQLVPLLGAGVSIMAGAPPDPHFQVGFHNVDKLVIRLWAELLAHAATHPTGIVASDLEKVHRLVDEMRLAELCELYVDSHLDSPNEAHAKLCEILCIKAYVRLRPTKAHRLLAFLACEGLLPEVITTNYDCCLEHAFAEARGAAADLVEASEPGDAECESEVDDFQWGRGIDLWVSHDLESYRRSACRMGGNDDSRGLPYLRVHKINGCARALRHACPKCRNHVAAQILLTEKQLQSWRERAWAADMVRDRLRTRKVLTCGFGSEEPQVRHTVALITEEELSARNRRRRQKRSLLERPNLVVVASFGPKPSFAQHQILTAQWNGHWGGEQAGALGAGAPYRPYDAFLGPQSRPGHFRFASRAGDTLPADDLWLELYGRVAERLLREELETRFSRSLRAIVPCGDALAEKVKRQVLLGKERASQRLFSWAQGKDALVASEMIAAVDPLERPRDELKYRSLRDKGELLLWILLIRIALGAEPVPVFDGREGLATVAVKVTDVATRSVALRASERLDGCSASVVLLVRRPHGAGAPTASARAMPFRKIRPAPDTAGAHGTLERGNQSVDLMALLNKWGPSLTNFAQFEQCVRESVAYPTEPQRLAQPGLVLLNRTA